MCGVLGIITKVITLIVGILFGIGFIRSAYILALNIYRINIEEGIVIEGVSYRPNEYVTNRVFAAGVVFFTGVLILLSDKFEKFWKKDKED